MVYECLIRRRHLKYALTNKGVTRQIELHLGLDTSGGLEALKLLDILLLPNDRLTSLLL